MSTKVAELTSILQQDDASKWVVYLWDKFHQQRAGKVAEWLELRDYIFATDTTTTSNSTLPWKNTVTTPKLCQIRDNLHSNYLSALFPNDNWLKWEGYSKESDLKEKADAIQGYMSNKSREGHFRTEISKVLYDYIDYGNSFITVDYETSSKEMPDGSQVPGYSGPKLRRISPLDIVFNPLATDFQHSFKIVRSVKTIGEIKKMVQDEPDQQFWMDVLLRRSQLNDTMGGYTVEDFEKAAGYSVDGFGNLHEYFQSDYVEILEFYGDYHNQATGELKTNVVITVADRSVMVREDSIPSWLGHTPIYHVGWRLRPDNLWAMGPLDNLVGMQYRIDHLENLKSDALDLIVHPPLKIIGEVEEFDWQPGAEIHIDENGDVGEVTKSLQGVVAASQDIQLIEAKMDMMAGAPREAMGIRTPGEKTAFEVGELQNAAGRIFQEKITNFEIEGLEPVLNAAFAMSRRLMDGSEVIRVMDNSIGVERFMTVTREDITASGKLRPIGARHFAKQAQDLQNFIGIFNSPIGQMVMPHTSGKALTEFVSDVTGLKGYDIFKYNVAVEEQKETQSAANSAEEDMIMEDEVSREFGV